MIGSPRTSPYYSLANIERLLKTDRIILRKIALKSGSYYDPYDEQEIKADGRIKWRHIANPHEELKKIQRIIYNVMFKKKMLTLPDGIIGGISGKSIKDNSKPHIRQEMVVTIDIKDCYPRTTHTMVFNVLRQEMGCGQKVAELLTKLTTLQRQLPQGAPTSNALCNLCLLPIFTEIKKYADENNIGFTLYVDDITISGKTINVVAAIPFVITTIQKHGYSVSNKKIRKMPANMPQEVTGTIVNQKVSIAHNKIEEIRTTIMQIARKKGGTSVSEYNSLNGKIQFVKSYSEEKGEKLEELAEMLLSKNIVGAENKQKAVTRKCRHHKTIYESSLKLLKS